MALSASKHTLLSHPMDRTAYTSVKYVSHSYYKRLQTPKADPLLPRRANFTFVRDLSKFTTNQKKYPRLIWVRRASLYHASRLRLNTFYRQRSTHDDALIRDIAELCMSKYVSVRKAAQRALAPITNLYDGTRTLLLDTFFDAIRRKSPSCWLYSDDG
jgi:proteasome activator subunit 4